MAVFMCQGLQNEKAMSNPMRLNRTQWGTVKQSRMINISPSSLMYCVSVKTNRSYEPEAGNRLMRFAQCAVIGSNNGVEQTRAALWFLAAEQRGDLYTSWSVTHCFQLDTVRLSLAPESWTTAFLKVIQILTSLFCYVI